MQWNARSHAAYQGYSHLSGIEITSLLKRCRHSRLRPRSRSGGRRRARRVAAEPAVDVERVVLLRPQEPGERLALDARASSAESCAGATARVELVGLATRAAKMSSKSANGGCVAASRVEKRAAARATRPARRSSV